MALYELSDDDKRIATGAIAVVYGSGLIDEATYKRAIKMFDTPAPIGEALERLAEWRGDDINRKWAISGQAMGYECALYQGLSQLVCKEGDTIIAAIDAALAAEVKGLDT